jgi:transcriptional regulator with XRE-family HTH domain
MKLAPSKEELSTMLDWQLKDIAIRYGVSLPTVSKWFRENNLEKVSYTGKKTKKVVPSREELEPLSKLSYAEISTRYGVCTATVRRWYLDKPHTKTKPSKEEVESLLHMSQKEVSDLYGITKQAVSLWAREYGLQFKKTAGLNRKLPIPPKEELELHKDKPVKEVADMYGVSVSSIRKWFISYNIPRPYLKPSKEELESLKHLTQKEIAKQFGIAQTYVSALFKKYNIER